MIDQFLSKIQAMPDGCWYWMGSRHWVSAQWERADPAKHDYDERWPYAQDGYVRIYVHRTIKSLCERCGCEYPHFFVAHADWRKVPLPFRSMQLCIGCFVAVSG